MRKLLLLSILMSCLLCEAQQERIDSLRNRISETKTDTGKLSLYSTLGNLYSYVHTDSSIYFAELALKAAKKINLPILVSDEYGSLGYSYYVAGDYVKSLRFILTAMSIAEEIEPGSTKIAKGYVRYLNMRDSMVSLDTLRSRLIGRHHYNLAGIYIRTGQINRSIQELLTSKKIFEEYKDSAFLYFSLSNLSNAYSLNGQYTEGVEAGQKALDLGARIQLTGTISWTKAYIGYNYLKLGKITEARKYFYVATKAASTANLRAQVLPYQYLAESFLMSKQIDSALFYAHQALHIAKEQKFKGMIMPIDTLLTAIHVAGKSMDSAYYYLRAANDLRDELLNAQKSQELQSIVESEQKRKTDLIAAKKDYASNLKLLGLGTGLLLLSLLLLLVYRSNRLKQKGYLLLQQQKEETDRQKAETEKALEDLKATQQQLVQSEKMASLGELTAGIAHEIQNPLNFINNFSEVTRELTAELKDELDQNNIDAARQIADDINANSEKIVHHGKRADSIVKNMLQHSRASSGAKEPADINALTDEYLRLSYHGLRAKDKSFNANMKTSFDDNVGKINIVQQDMGRVLLNLFNNAFYAVSEKRKQYDSSYEPVIEVSTISNGDKVIIHIKDNGIGIPQKVVDKIYQPFFTTKPTGEGTGLGLSLSYDIVTRGHGGNITVNTREGEGTEFTIVLPKNQTKPQQ